MATRPSLHPPPLFQVYPPLSSKNFGTPPSDSIFGRSYPPFNTFFLTLLIFYFSFFCENGAHSESCQTSKSFLQKKKRLNSENRQLFPQKLNIRCLIGMRMRHRISCFRNIAFVLQFG